MKKIVIVLGVSLVVLALINFPTGKTFPPDEMAGTWQSDDARYNDRFFRLTKTTVIFGTGNTDIDVYFITDTKVSIKGSDEVVQLSLHRPGEADIMLSLIHDDNVDIEEKEESLRLLNQPKVFWYRVNEEELVLF